MKNYILIESADHTDFTYRMTGALSMGYETVGSLSVQQIIIEEATPHRMAIRKLHYAQGLVQEI